MSEEEFWRSTLAKVTELYKIQILTWARTRDYFVADLCALYLSVHRSPDSTRVFEAEDLLQAMYPRRKKTVMITVDPDRGAECNWQDLKAALKAKGGKRK